MKPINLEILPTRNIFEDVHKFLPKSYHYHFLNNTGIRNVFKGNNKALEIFPRFN